MRGAQLRLGVVSCANYEHGYFAAYRHLADESPDLAIFLGDYIYESVDKSRHRVRKHSDGVEATTLPLYRNRYAQYRLDPDLQRLHAEVPCVMTWDDHEVQNDYADQWAQTFEDPALFLKRRAAAYQAYYEHMPLRPSRSLPNGPSMRVHDRFQFGGLVEISLLDGRQYRSREACDGRRTAAVTSRPRQLSGTARPHRSLLGAEQESWLFAALAQSRARWNLLAQDVLMAQLHQRNRDGEIQFWTDDWNGYPAARQRLFTHLHDTRVSNPVVLSGDIHSFWSNDLKLDFDDAAAPVVATEFVTTSVSAHPPPYDLFVKFLPDNPHVHYFESRKRGYTTIQIEPKPITTRFRASATPRPATGVTTLKSFVVENGRPGAIAIAESTASRPRPARAAVARGARRLARAVEARTERRARQRGGSRSVRQQRHCANEPRAAVDARVADEARGVGRGAEFVAGRPDVQDAVAGGRRRDGGRLAGDLYLVGAGDPSLTGHNLWALAAQLKGAGITAVGGRLVVIPAPFASVECETKDRCDAGKISDNAFDAPLASIGIDFGTWCIDVRATRSASPRRSAAAARSCRLPFRAAC